MNLIVRGPGGVHRSLPKEDALEFLIRNPGWLPGFGAEWYRFNQELHHGHLDYSEFEDGN